MSTLWHASLLAWWYLRAAPTRTAVLVCCTALALFLPLFTALAAERVEATLMARAEASPVLIGHQGNEFDLTMNGLYFRGAERDPVPFGTAAELEELSSCLRAAGGAFDRYFDVVPAEDARAAVGIVAKASPRWDLIPIDEVDGR